MESRALLKNNQRGFAITEILVAASILAIVALILNSSVIDYIKVSLQKEKSAKTDSAAANIINNISTGDNKAIISNFQPTRPNGTPPPNFDSTIATLMARYPFMRANSSASSTTSNARSPWVLIKSAANKLLPRYISNGSQVCSGNSNPQLGRPLGSEILPNSNDPLYPSASDLAGLNNPRVFVRIQPYDVVTNVADEACTGQGNGLRLVPQGPSILDPKGLKVTTTIQHTDDSGNIKFNQSQALLKPEADFAAPNFVTANSIPAEIKPQNCAGPSCVCDNSKNYCAMFYLGSNTRSVTKTSGQPVVCADTGSPHSIELAFAASERAVAFYCLVTFNDNPANDYGLYKPCNDYSDGNVVFSLNSNRSYPNDSSPFGGLGLTIRPAAGNFFNEGVYKIYVAIFDAAGNRSTQDFNFNIGVDLNRPTLSGTPQPAVDPTSSGGTTFIDRAGVDSASFGRQVIGSTNTTSAIQGSNLGGDNLFQCANATSMYHGWQLTSSNFPSQTQVADLQVTWVATNSGGAQVAAPTPTAWVSNINQAVFTVPNLPVSGRYTVTASIQDQCGAAGASTTTSRDWYYDSGATFSGTFWSVPDGVGQDNFMGGPQFGFSANPEGNPEILDTYVWKLKGTGTDDGVNAGPSTTGRINVSSCTRQGSKGFCPRIFDGCGRRSVVTPPIFYQVLADTGQPCGTVKCGRSTDICSRDTNTCVTKASCMADSSCSSGARCYGCNAARTRPGWCGGKDAGPSGGSALPDACPNLVTAACGGSTGTGDPAILNTPDCPICLNPFGACQSNSDCCSGIPCSGGTCCIPNGSSGSSATCCSGYVDGSGKCAPPPTPTPVPPPTATPEIPPPESPTPTPARTPNQCIDEGGSCAKGETCCSSLTCTNGVCVGAEKYVTSSDCQCTFNGKSVYSNSITGNPTNAFSQDCETQCWNLGAVEANNFCQDKTAGTRFQWRRNVYLNYNSGPPSLDPTLTGFIDDTCGMKSGKVHACCTRDSSANIPPLCDDYVRGDTLTKLIDGCHLSYDIDVTDFCKNKQPGDRISPTIWWKVDIEGAERGGETIDKCPSN